MHLFPLLEICYRRFAFLSVLSLPPLSAPGAIQAQEKSADASHAAGWVVIPVEEYRVLRAKAYPVEHDPEPPPLDATLTRVDYDLHITGELAAGRATLTIDVLKDGWVRVPMPAGLLVREARIDGKLVSLVPGATGKGGSHLSALLSHAGRSVLTLDVDVPIAASDWRREHFPSLDGIRRNARHGATSPARHRSASERWTDLGEVRNI